MSDDAQSAPKPPPGRAYEVLTPGEKFGDYQILKCLSYDLMGSFYRVRRARESEERTIFVLPPLVGGDMQFRQRFTETTEKLKEFEHPGIFSVRDTEMVKERYTIFSDDFSGQNMADYLETRALEAAKKTARKQPETDELLADQPFGLPADEVREILQQVLDALKYAHDNKVLHLNLNPTNILRAHDGSVKITGLGLMTMAGKQLFESLVSAGIPPISLGPRRIRINTVDILSPEVRLGKPGDHRSDIYALGLTTYWMLTGRKPAYDYKPPSEYVEDLAPGWDMLVAKCLERDPDKRYQSAGAVLRDLSRLDELHLRPVPEEAGTRETKTVFRHIDFIPVPRGIQARGIIFARAFRLGIIGLFGVVLAFIAASFYKLVFEEDGGGGAVVAVKAPEGKTPRLLINISPENASLRFPKEELNFITRDGELRLNVLPGSYRIEVVSPQHITEKQLIQITDEPQTLDISLKPDWATVEIVTTPGANGVAIDKNGVRYELGIADAAGKLRVAQRLYAGAYQLNLSRPGYRPLSVDDFDVSGGEEVNQVEYPLEPIPGTLRVRSEPQGANVILDGKVLGQSNLTVENLPVLEEFMITLRKPGYRDKILAVTLQPNTRTPLDFGTLEREHGSIIPALTFEGQPATPELLEDVQFVVETVSTTGTDKKGYNGASLDPHDPILADVPAGKVTLTVKHPEYVTLERTFQLPDNAKLSLPLDLATKPGTIVLSPHPTGLPLTLTVNGRSREVGESMQFAVKPGETYELVLEAPDYLPVKRSIQLRPNERLTWDATLQPVPGPDKGKPYLVPYVGAKLVWIPEGSFTMGSPVEEASRLPEEGPQTRVTLTKPFWMSAHEISQAQYKSVMKANPSRFTGDEKPVDSVTFQDPLKFCAAINAREQKAGRIPAGYEYRLPTEAEWEYAARAGSNTPFHWGATAAGGQEGNFKGEYPRDFTSSTINDDSSYGSKNVGSYAPNAFGLYDMHGNVREWCLDYYNARLPGGSESDWVQMNKNSRRVTRGGGWENFAIHSRAATRGEGQRETTPSSATGFRLVLGPKIAMPN